MMDIQDEKNYVFNIRLAKLIGLYQMLNPGTKKCRGQKVYHIVSAFIVLYVCVIWTIFNNFSDEDRIVSSQAALVKMICSIPSYLFQTFMICYLLENLNNQKDSIIFALYSSNWTNMDMKCKKLVLLTMIMNNANHKKLKFTSTRIVNLEMFLNIMRGCYSILLVLINYIKKN